MLNSCILFSHVHVDKGSSTAKFWLINISLSKNNGFSPAE
ncbi:MAG: DUF4160 domain-containing protein, partial [Ignavibacteriaceae bacterium]|nr:DUF4160 domain-containing protein [Ignavibacteriaceae bacterium]